MANTNKTDFPDIDAPFVDDDFRITIPWHRLLAMLWRRTGNASGSVSGGDQIETILTPSSSPFIFNPNISGTLLVSGGGVTSMTIKRGSTGVARTVGQYYCGHRMSSSDTITITYMALPSISFYPS